MMNTIALNKFPGTNIARRILRFVLVLLLVLAVLAGGIYFWAFLSTDTSLIARGIMWGDSDTGDLYRFPTRQMQAAVNPVIFEPVSESILSQVPITDEAIQAFDMPFETYLEKTNTTAFIALQGNRLLYEGYFNGASRESIQSSFSAAKSFASTLVGIAIEEGFIGSLDDPVTDYLPELLDRNPNFAQITIRHLLMMASGLRWERSDSNPFSDDFISYYSPDLRETALDTEIIEPPGGRFLYNDYNPLLVGMVLERATGMTVSEYMESRLWQPMGAEGGGSWSLDSEKSGFEKMSVGVNGRAIDTAKLGWLFLHEGKNGQRQVVPAEWVIETTTLDNAIETSRGEHANYYNNYWWLDVENEAYYAEGDFCQFIYVYPATDLVLVRHGADCGGVYWTGMLGELAKFIENELAQ